MTDTEAPDQPSDLPLDDVQDVAPEVSMLRHVALSDLELEHKFWRNPRSHTGLDAAAIEELASSIKENTTSLVEGEGDDGQIYAGIRHPLEVLRILGTNDTVINLVIDGQRRFMAATMLEIPDILIPVIDLVQEPIEFTPAVAAKYLAQALDTVGTRAGLSSFELSESAERLRGSKNDATGKDYTLAEIAQSVHRSESWVSKMLKARGASTPALLHKWKTGQITDEQFKDLAQAKDPEHQKKEAERVAEARQSGNKAEARTLAKEQKEVAKASASPKASTPAAKASAKPTTSKPGAVGQQTSMPSTPPRKAPPTHVVTDLMALADRIPPTSDYVKGVMDGIRYATGAMDPEQFSKAWNTYMHHASVQNTKPDKPNKAKGKKSTKKKSGK